MAEDWKVLFDRWSSKPVSKTDKVKGAYVLTADQKAVMEEAGLLPTDGPSDRVLSIDLIGNEGEKLQVSYYNSIRQGANRPPEARMGREIVTWIEVGDVLTIGRIGTQIFFAKSQGSGSVEPAVEEIGRRLSRSLDARELLKRARKAKGKPARRLRTASDFVRNPYVVAAVLLRSGDQCEMPACARELFERPDQRPYLEVHHVLPLAEEGEDTIENAAALCPACHRELHHGRLKQEKRSKLAAAIQAKSAIN